MPYAYITTPADNGPGASKALCSRTGGVLGKSPQVNHKVLKEPFFFLSGFKLGLLIFFPSFTRPVFLWLFLLLCLSVVRFSPPFWSISSPLTFLWGSAIEAKRKPAGPAWNYCRSEQWSEAWLVLLLFLRFRGRVCDSLSSGIPGKSLENGCTFVWGEWLSWQLHTNEYFFRVWTSRVGPKHRPLQAFNNKALRGDPGELVFNPLRPSDAHLPRISLGSYLS